MRILNFSFLGDFRLAIYEIKSETALIAVVIIIGVLIFFANIIFMQLTEQLNMKELEHIRVALTAVLLLLLSVLLALK